jgi:streptogramin lyase
MKINFLLTICLLLSITTIAQEYWHRYDASNSGLKNKAISSIALGQGNDIWIAYAGAGGEGIGVSKFDGANWFHYDKTNSGLPNNDIRAMVSDHSGNVWFACYNGGIVKFNGTLWTPYTFANSDIVGDNVSALYVDEEDNLWVGAYFDGVSKFDGTSWTNYDHTNSPFPENNCINDITIDHDGNLWVGTDCSGGLHKFNVGSQSWTSYSTSNSGLKYHTVSSVLEDQSGKIWIGYPTSLNVISVLDGNTWTHHAAFTKSPGTNYKSFALDGDGNLLCGSSENGLLKFDGNVWTHPISGNDSGKSSFSSSVVVDSHGAIWWAEAFAGLWTNAETNLPEVPGDFNAVALTAESVMLTWTESLGATSFELERMGPGDNDFQLIETLPQGVDEFVDIDLNEGTLYKYRVRASNSFGKSRNSDVRSVLTNFRPTGPSFEKEVSGIGVFHFTMDDFTSHFTDPDPTDELKAIELTSLPTKGKLKINGTDVNALRSISATDLSDLEYLPLANENDEDEFSFFFNDGKDNSLLASNVIINIESFQVVGVGDEFSESVVHFFPNPVATDLTITCTNNNKKYEVAIFSMVGDELRRESVYEDTIVLPMTDYAPGLYVVKVFAGNTSGTMLKVFKK